MKVGTFLTSQSILRDAHRNLDAAGDVMQDASRKLSSGKRVVSAKDDAAAISTAARLKSLQTGSSQGMRNAMQAMNMVEVAEYALQTQSNLLLQMQDLALQASSDLVTDAERAALQAKLVTAQDEYDRIALSSTFEQKQLLQGSFEPYHTQVSPTQDGNTMITMPDSTGTQTGTTFRTLAAHQAQEVTFEGSDAFNKKQTGLGADLRTLYVELNQDLYLIKLDALMTAETLAQAVNDLDGIDGVQASILPGTGTGHPTESTGMKKLSLQFGLEEGMDLISLEQGELSYSIENGVGQKVDVVVNLTRTQGNAEDLGMAIRDAFEAQKSGLEQLGIQAVVSTVGADVTLYLDPEVVEKPLVNVFYQDTSPPTTTPSFQFKVGDGISQFAYDPTTPPTQSTSFLNWTDIQEKIPIETFQLADLAPAGIGETGELKMDLSQDAF